MVDESLKSVNYELALLALTIGITLYQVIYLIYNYFLFKRKEYVWYIISMILMIIINYYGLNEKNFYDYFLGYNQLGVILFCLSNICYYIFVNIFLDIKKSDQVIYTTVFVIILLCLVLCLGNLITYFFEIENERFLGIYSFLSMSILMLSYFYLYFLYKYKNKDLAIFIIVGGVVYNLIFSFIQTNFFKVIMNMPTDHNGASYFMFSQISESFFIMFALSYKTKLLYEENIKNQKSLMETKLIMLKDQVKPHFIFNCLNAINRYIVGNDSEKASNLLIKFSKLIRTITNKGDKNFISLEEEIEFCKNYVEIERLRMGKDFIYEELIADNNDLKNINIPPMLLQTFYENAIHHGLANKVGEKRLRLSVYSKEGYFLINVEDNGVGRKEIEKSINKTHTSRGLRLAEDRLKIMSEILRKNSYFKVIDLKDNDKKPLGTIVSITLSN
jgi:sensor histidine kinase YesM